MNYIKRLEGEDIVGNQIYIDLDEKYHCAKKALEDCYTFMGGSLNIPKVGNVKDNE